MDLEYPLKYCMRSPNHAHLYLNKYGNIWRCKYCWSFIWIPSDFQEAARYAQEIRNFGIQVAYNKWLKRRPKVKELMIKLDKIRYLWFTVPENQFPEVVAAIITDKEVTDAVAEDKDKTSDMRKLDGKVGKRILKDLKEIGI